MSISLQIPTATGSVESIDVQIGQHVYILGANGTGKSSLMHRLYNQHQAIAHRISGHRLTWLGAEDVVLGQTQEQAEQQSKNNDRQPTAVWKDDTGTLRNSLSVLKLVDGEHDSNRKLAEAYKAGDEIAAKSRALEDSPLDTLNRVFTYSNLPISLSLQDYSRVRASKRGGAPYPLAHLSDGERNALFLASDILTVPAGTLVLVDEPEKHLHRSIIAPLLTHLFSIRSDCMFVVSTHEVQLPLEADSSKIVLVRDCVHHGSTIQSWAIDIVDSNAQLDESIKRDILGGRRSVLFVEGEGNSLDKLLYAILFPGISVVPKSGSSEVEKAVIGTRNSADLHWINAFGVIDNDRRTNEQVASLRERGVYSLPLHTIESIYYHPSLQLMAATRHAEVVGGDPNIKIAEANARLVDAVRPHIQRLSERVSEKQVRWKVEMARPGLDEIRTGNPIDIQIDVAAIVAVEVARLTEALDSSDVETIITKYPFRETPAIDRVVSALGFSDRQQYEEVVRKLLCDDNHALQHVRGYFGDLIFNFSIS